MGTEKKHPIFHGKRASLRFHPDARRALRRVVARFQLDSNLKFEGEPPSQEALLNALCLAAEEMVADAAGLERVARWLAPYLARVERLPRKGSAATEPAIRPTDFHGDSTRRDESRRGQVGE